MKEHRIILEGNNEFPITMLKTNQCYPASEADALRMLEKGKRRVCLYTLVLPMDNLWSMYGWERIGKTGER